ncbi:glycolipid transfer protein domain-containing protein 2 [Megalops cyprinoides]|uniref:glycolipid transfer protein domain-containing protein 2 n=1 Tax=Megalops cyprinoides TaxID=118141 RepID=UPI0018651173|nr:glycolipid transfer protein domain-containing protein 2 [Megalops cyprinoides]
MVTMGVKIRAAVAIVIILVFLGSLWLQGGLENQWRSCFKSYSPKLEPSIITILNNSGSEEDMDSAPLSECPGQDFQISRLLSHLQSAPAAGSDVLLPPYLSSWDELIKFMDALGPMVGLISQEIEGKTSIIRELARLDAERGKEGAKEDDRRKGTELLHTDRQTDWDAEVVQGRQRPQSKDTDLDNHRQLVTFPDFGESYLSVRSMIREELRRGSVNFERQNDSGCRTLLRLHRALLWLQLFLKKLGEKPANGGRLRSPSELCREAYEQTLAQHHSWLVRRAAELAFIAMPDRRFFLRLVCVQNQEEAAHVLNRVVRAIGEVYRRTQVALEEHGMLDLP